MPEPNQLQNIVFVYAKDKKIKALGLDESKIQHNALILDNWVHTATMNACMWIEHLHNESKNWNDEIKSLSKKVNRLTDKR